MNSRLISKKLIGILMIAMLNSSLARADENIVSNFFSSLGQGLSSFLGSMQKRSTQDDSSTAVNRTNSEVDSITAYNEAQLSGPVITTSDSRVNLRLQIPAGAQWVTAYITKDGTQYDPLAKALTQFKVDPNSETQSIVLGEGPGNYTLNFWYTTHANSSGPVKSLMKIRVLNLDTGEHQFAAPAFEIQSEDRSVQELAYSLTKDATSDEERLAAIRKWVSENIKYDKAEEATRNQINSVIKDKDKWQSSSVFDTPTHPQDAVSVIQSRSAVCEGFSSALAALTRAAGLKSKVVIGYKRMSPKDYADPEVCKKGSGSPHAWNQVYLADTNTWVSVDTTVDRSNYLGYLARKNVNEEYNQKVRANNEEVDRWLEARYAAHPGLKEYYKQHPELLKSGTSWRDSELAPPEYPKFGFDPSIYTACYDKIN
jgi:transglutaminase-like putative cysteine protease